MRADVVIIVCTLVIVAALLIAADTISSFVLVR